MFRGNYSATVDERGRIRLPSAHLEPINSNFSGELFLTSIEGDNMRIYPMETWIDIEKKLLNIPSMNPSRSKLLGRLTFFGQMGRLDKSGRIVIPQTLRNSASLENEVSVLGYIDYLEVWNSQLYLKKLKEQPLTDDDLRLLSDLGI